MSKRIIIDLDHTITVHSRDGYEKALPNKEVIEKLRFYHKQGFEIVIHSSRNMRTFDGNLGKINRHTLPIVLNWLNEHSVPYDEIYMGKPWCGMNGFYVDDRAIRPEEFVDLSLDQINQLLKITVNRDN